MVGEPVIGDVRDDKDEVLGRIRAALRVGSAPETSRGVDAPVAETIGAEQAHDPVALARRFAHELALVGGETRFVERETDLAPAIAAFAEERGLGPASAQPATADYAVLHAAALLADTGTALVVEHDPSRLLAPYLPRTCCIVADAKRIFPRMDAASMDAAFGAARSGAPGEAVLVTGPSRTADIEKTLVLGAHGPKTVVVFIVGIAPADARAAI